MTIGTPAPTLFRGNRGVGWSFDSGSGLAELTSGVWIVPEGVYRLTAKIYWTNADVNSGNDRWASKNSPPRLEHQSENSIGGEPLEPGQVWTISPGGLDDNPGLYRIEINEGPGSGVKILNKPVPPAFRESIGYAEQNLYTRTRQLVGDRDPRRHEFTAELRAFDASKSGAKLGVAALIALCTSLLKKSVRGGLIIVGEINLGGSIEPTHNPVTIAEIAVERVRPRSLYQWHAVVSFLISRMTWLLKLTSSFTRMPGMPS